MLLNFPDGTTQTIVSDQSWKCSPSPITFSCIYGGEDYDARDDPPAWDMPNFAGNGWSQPILTSSPGGTLRSQSAPPLRVIKTFSPVQISNPAADLVVYDLGQNFSGWPRIKTKGQAGSKIELIPGELLDASGRVSQRSCGSPISFSFTSAGKPQTWHPEFSFTGFRYVEARGDIASIEQLDAQFIHSSAATVGSFSCSNPLFNQIHELIHAAIASNLQSVLTDCPHREKLGWLEQSHLMGPAIMFNYDVPLLYAKICADMREAQQSDGCVPTIAPEYTKFTGQYADFSNSPEWGSAAVINPWLTFQQYGDAQILRDNYDMMRRYVQYLHGRRRTASSTLASATGTTSAPAIQAIPSSQAKPLPEPPSTLWISKFSRRRPFCWAIPPRPNYAPSGQTRFAAHFRPGSSTPGPAITIETARPPTQWPLPWAWPT